ncbi:HAMP domain-containing histidine kinase [Bacillus cereus ATCC 10876]|uniref:sensor histidine kinase n=1 Tax=Bacillus TaxID=1386 RepID=UPI00031DF2C3|nr:MULTISPECIES: HAMP domain-containing sensor histidine kinase [Bacillus]MDJ0284063.1 HAMP domain-containing sensor histidine kinase [Bacillus bombysepticus]KFL63345.1 histidine kinase-, DNA gyrase B-, and HSP90-like ATPase family protein [Bacillus cereus ATCC 10876]MBO1130215.1 HAMP domain-containing histidine kinase [Bacillus cereus]MDJ0297804.1 HAMP domain-containing sensor histidine kinase [Bacillus bombysepticus]MDJ0303591.1 HAMP domain-containing sensor histidine kinase [Bacillus bombys
MKLFLKDHLSFIILYIITFISLPIVINRLDGFENHYTYFIFLACSLLIVLLFGRYLRRKKMYAHIGNKNIHTDSFMIYQPIAPYEKAYATQLQYFQSLFLSKEEEYKSSLHNQQLMISYAVHQMKTPLSVIQLLIQSNQFKEPNSLAEWQKVKVECDKLNFSLNQLLTYSRSTKLLADLKIEPILLKHVVQEVINDLRDYFIEEEIFPKSTIPEHILLYSDRKWLKVVVYQLLSNAVKYGEKHSSIMIHYENGNLFIQNKGETIPESEIKRVFELFYTGTKGRTKGEATGIGLYLVNRILTTLNHPYHLHSKDNETTFTIDFSRSIETATK